MKITLKIAKLQLLNLMYSPISWVVLTIFALYSGLSFTDKMNELNEWIKMMGKIQGPITNHIFYDYGNGYFPKVQNLLFLFIPILSMGLISNEKNSGTIKLLYSSPLKIRSIVMGKYLAMLFYCVAVVLVMAMVVLGAGLFVQHMDYGFVFSGLLAFFLLVSTYSAIGLFMSSLTRYQVISGIATIVLLFALDYISNLGQESTILADILNWMSVSSHTENMLSGNLISYDVLYFVIVSVLFLAFTVNKMKADHLGKKGKLKMQLLSLSYLVITGVLIAFITMPNLSYYKDVTANKRHTSNQGIIDIYESLNEAPLNITTYENMVSASQLLPKNRRAYARGFNGLKRYIKDVNLEYQFFYAPTRRDLFEGRHH